MRIRAADVDQALADAGHQESEYDPATQTWDPGYRAWQLHPRAAALVHDGPGRDDGLTAYTATLRAAGYHVLEDEPLDDLRRLIVTRP